MQKNIIILILLMVNGAYGCETKDALVAEWETDKIFDIKSNTYLAHIEIKKNILRQNYCSTISLNSLKNSAKETKIPPIDYNHKVESIVLHEYSDNLNSLKNLIAVCTQTSKNTGHTYLYSFTERTWQLLADSNSELFTQLIIKDYISVEGTTQDGRKFLGHSNGLNLTFIAQKL